MNQPAMTRIATVLADLDKVIDDKVLASRQRKTATKPDVEPCGDVCVCNNTCGCADDD